MLYLGILCNSIVLVLLLVNRRRCRRRFCACVLTLIYSRHAHTTQIHWDITVPHMHSPHSTNDARRSHTNTMYMFVHSVCMYSIYLFIYVYTYKEADTAASRVVVRPTTNLPATQVSPCLRCSYSSMQQQPEFGLSNARARARVWGFVRSCVAGANVCVCEYVCVCVWGEKESQRVRRRTTLLSLSLTSFSSRSVRPV